MTYDYTKLLLYFIINSNAISKYFYLSVADATGKLPDGIFKLDLQTYGNMPECLDIDVIGQNGLDPFK